MTTYWCEVALVGNSVARDVVIEVIDGRFSSVKEGGEAPAGAVLLAGITVPGFANAHSHAFHRALRSRTQVGKGSFWTWRDLMYRAAARLTPETYHQLARATFAEMAMAGITVVGEFHYLHHQLDGTPYADSNVMGEALLAAASEAGIRITLLDTLYLHGGLSADGYVDLVGAQRCYSDSSAESWASRVDALKGTSTQKIGVAIHSVRAVDPEAIRIVADWACTNDAPVHAHVSEQPAENHQCMLFHGMTPTELLADAEVLGERFSAVHGTHLTPEDIHTYGTTGSTICFCPTTERDLGDGIGPSAELVEAGACLSLGSDSHAVINMFAEARAIELNERLRSQQRGIHTVEELMTMATTNGHRSLGWHDAGTIVPGNRADLVTFSLCSPRTAGSAADTAVETAVFAASPADITSVVIEGVPIVDNGKHLKFDVAKELRDAILPLMEG